MNLLSHDMAVDVSFLPAMKRRRLSALSRLSLRLAHSVAPKFQGACVFGSQHGELVTTQGLLQSIVDADVMSPAGFSSSVHNTAVGLHSINSQNTAPCTSIAAGCDSLAMCFIEAYSLLEQAPVDEVLIVFADDNVPEPLDHYVPINQRHGMAVVVSRLDAADDNAVLTLERIDKSAVALDRDPVSPVISSLIRASSMGYTVGELCDWSWQFGDR